MKKIVNKYYKSALYIFVLAISLATITSCEDELEIDPASNYATGNFYKTVTHAELGVKGIYDVFTLKQTYSHLLSLLYPMDNDVTYMRGTGFTNDNRKVAHYGLTPVISYAEKTWIELYRGINYANTAIASIQDMDLYKNGSEDEKIVLEKLIAEAKFLRAFIYFDLVRLWGDIPLVTKPSTLSDDFNVARTPKSEVYDLIVQDLIDARDVLPKETPLSNDRAHWGAAQSYLVRVLMYRAGYSLGVDGVMSRPSNHKEYYKQAASEAMLLKNSGLFDLLGSYEQVFKNLAIFTQDPTENIFEIAMYNVAHDGEDDGIIGTWNSPKTHASSPYGRANAYVLIHPEFVNEYSVDDVRKDVAVANFEILKDGSQKALKTGKPMYPGKWRRDWIAEPAQNPNNTNVNWCTIRYADVLLMMAEAINEVRDDLPVGVVLDDAFIAINDVRQRAGLVGISNALEYAELLAAIKQERKLELVGEGWRKFDLIRWNELGAKIRETQQMLEEKYSKDTEGNNSVGYVAGVYFQDNKHELLPIPQREMDENVNLSQNPGY